MNKKFLILFFLFSTTSYSSDFVSIINQNNNSQYVLVNAYTKVEEQTDWINNGDVYNCSEWLPLAIDYNYGTDVSQSQTCKQNQTSIINTYHVDRLDSNNKTLIKSEEINKTIDVAQNQIVNGEYLTKNLCADILERGESTGNGIYSIDLDGHDSTYSPINAYCDMENGGWTLYDNFGTYLVEAGNEIIPSAYNSNYINSTDTLASSGYSYYLTNINVDAYMVSDYYLQFYYTGSSVNGYISKKMPTWISKIRVSTTNPYNNYQYINYNGNSITINPYTDFKYYEFNGSGTLNVSEHGVVWIDSVWVK